LAENKKSFLPTRSSQLNTWWNLSLCLIKKRNKGDLKKMNSAMKRPLELRAMPGLIEQRNSLLEQMDEIINKAKEEKRSLSPQESKSFDIAKTECERIDKTLEAEKSLETRVDFKPAKKAGEIDVTAEERAFIRFCQTGEQRDLSASGSGVIIPKTVQDRVISRVRELSPLYNRATHFSAVGNLSIPVYDYMTHTTSFIESFQEVTATGGSFSTVDMVSHAIGTLSKIGKSLLIRSDIDVLMIIVNQMAMSISNFLSNEIINNSNAKFSGTLLSVTQNITGAGVTADNLVALQMAVPSIHQSQAAWLMHPTTFTAVRQLKDTTANYLMISENEGFAGDIGYKLLGKEVMLDENMPVVGAGARSIYYGNFGALYINTNAPLSVQILTEAFSSQYAVGIMSTQELDITLAEPRGLAVYIGA
jgi:HK97 family phage major capsid protein